MQNCIPFFIGQGGLKAVARSMPTSNALDRVANKYVNKPQSIYNAIYQLQGELTKNLFG
jgi:hypothetical protein